MKINIHLKQNLPNENTPNKNGVKGIPANNSNSQSITYPNNQNHPNFNSSNNSKNSKGSNHPNPNSNGQGNAFGLLKNNEKGVGNSQNGNGNGLALGRNKGNSQGNSNGNVAENSNGNGFGRGNGLARGKGNQNNGNNRNPNINNSNANGNNGKSNSHVHNPAISRGNTNRNDNGLNNANVNLGNNGNGGGRSKSQNNGRNNTNFNVEININGRENSKANRKNSPNANLNARANANENAAFNRQTNNHNANQNAAVYKAKNTSENASFNRQSNNINGKANANENAVFNRQSSHANANAAFNRQSNPNNNASANANQNTTFNRNANNQNSFPAKSNLNKSNGNNANFNANANGILNSNSNAKFGLSHLGNFSQINYSGNSKINLNANSPSFSIGLNQNFQIAVHILFETSSANVQNALRNFTGNEIVSAFYLSGGIVIHLEDKGIFIKNANRNILENNILVKQIISTFSQNQPIEKNLQDVQKLWNLASRLVAECGCSLTIDDLKSAIQKNKISLDRNNLRTLVELVKIVRKTQSKSSNGEKNSFELNLVALGQSKSIKNAKIANLQARQNIKVNAQANASNQLTKPTEKSGLIDSIKSNSIDKHILAGKERGENRDFYNEKTEINLRNKLDFYPHYVYDRQISTFEGSAEKQIAKEEFINNYYDEIQAWLDSGKHRFVKDFEFDKPIGMIVDRDVEGFITANKVRIVLVRDGSVDGWHFLRSFLVS